MEGGTTLKRALGCYLIFAMSDDALEEVFDVVVDTMQYYQETDSLELPPEPQSRTTVAGQVHKSERSGLLTG